MGIALVKVQVLSAAVKKVICYKRMAFFNGDEKRKDLKRSTRRASARKSEQEVHGRVRRRAGRESQEDEPWKPSPFRRIKMENCSKE